MGSVDPVDDRTFKVNFSGDGAAKLREKVKDKLKEFMGDYTDDTLVEYVIVLLRNGRRKEEARNELNVFLGDDSHSFVSWLWDHLSANLDLYVQPQESHVVEAAKTKFTSANQAGDNDSHQLDSESQGGKSSKLSQNQPNREGEGLARDAADGPPLSRSEVDNMHFEEKTDRKVRRERSSPQTSFQKKRSRIDERELSKEATVDAPRRLLQFAVRDALGTSKPSVSSKEPSLKRLRSVVSTSTGDSLSMDRPRRIRSVARVPNAMATVIKAVAEAAEDVRKVKSAGGSVFDRLSRGTDVPETLDQFTEIREAAGGDEEYIDLSKCLQQTQPVNRRRSDYSGQYVGNVAVLENESALDSMSDNEGYDTVSVIGHRGADVRWTNSSGVNKNEDLMMVQYSLANNVDDVRRRAWNEGQNKANAATTASRKVANNPVNVNAWKPPNYQESREVADYDCQKSVQQSEAGADKSTVRSMKENNNPVTVGNGNGKPAADIQRESPKMMSNAGASTAGRPLEDADSRTIFVSNVHFAATKDALSRHFNKFGEVLKVVILTDAATGQPKGSAYVEFMRKEAADDALALDGTSFMSRMLKVVKRSSAQQEAMPIMTWPHNRGSPYTAARFQFQRGITGGFRPHYSVKTGPRSLQWTREKQATSAESGVSGPGTSALVCTRSRTYVRTVSKSGGKSGT